MNKYKALFISSILLLSTQSMMAEEKDSDWWDITKKIGKKLILVPTVAVATVAEAAEEYQNGGDTLDVIGAGLEGGSEKVVESVEETVDDLGRIKDVAVEEYENR